ncbi:MAG: YicC family protein [Bacteroides sp.]|nr:YicC family protein [Bacteroidales bacterium]MBD5251215.1 YicC family protein [Barnesiella sp.]MBD5343504.1 YicC family protein [Bacteroides sp.]MBD5368108.1 YicC family protein [Bacteroides sp.]
MLYSMTGFGRAIVEIPNKKITVEIKSLNSKQMDVATRIPSSLREIDLDVRNLVARRLERGKVDLTVTIESVSAEAVMKLNMPVIEAYKQQIDRMGEMLGIGAPADWYATLLRFPDSMKADSATEADEDEKAAVIAAVGSAVEGLMHHRRAEGEKLEEFFRVRVARIADLLERITPYEEERVAKVRARITDALEKVVSVDYDRSRLEQELIYYIEKLDVNEEKQRLAQHLQYFLETLEGPAGQGKKLGFIAQEMGREINTLGSKSNHAMMQKIVVDMKDELEQIKEQVLNAM